MIRKIFYIFSILFLLNSFFAGQILAKEAETFLYDSRGNRDPFNPLITQRVKVAAGLEDVETADDITVEGIAWDRNGDSVAILNGVIVKNGQRIGNVTIKKIEVKSVILSINETEYKINLITKGEEANEN